MHYQIIHHGRWTLLRTIRSGVDSLSQFSFFFFHVNGRLSYFGDAVTLAPSRRWMTVAAFSVPLKDTWVNGTFAVFKEIHFILLEGAASASQRQPGTESISRDYFVLSCSHQKLKCDWLRREGETGPDNRWQLTGARWMRSTAPRIVEALEREEEQKKREREEVALYNI